MWVAKVSINGKTACIGSRTLKHRINLFGFPLSFFYERKWIIVNISGILIGKEREKREFIKDWKKSGRLENLELNKDFFIGTIKEPIFAKTIYNKNIIHLTPVLIDEKGWETMNVGSFNREIINKFLATLEKNYETKIHYLKQEKIKNISVMQENPQLTEKQKEAINLGIKNGYYNYPRKTSIEKLARLSGLSFSTFHAHLRKAEQKLLPYSFSH